MVKKKDKDALLGLRAFVILEMAVALGVMAGWASYQTAPVFPAAVAAGLTAAVGTLIALHKIIHTN